MKYILSTKKYILRARYYIVVGDKISIEIEKYPPNIEGDKIYVASEDYILFQLNSGSLFQINNTYYRPETIKTVTFHRQPMKDDKPKVVMSPALTKEQAQHYIDQIQEHINDTKTTKPKTR